MSILATLSLVPGLTLLARIASAGAGSDRPRRRRTAARGAAQAPARRLHWTPRPEQYPATVTTTDLAITMDDGVVLRADLVRPARADGSVVAKPLPVIITITAYNKSVLATGGLGGPSADYLVKRGYAQLTVDARGTGASKGVWEAFSPRETKDYGEVVGGRTGSRGATGSPG